MDIRTKARGYIEIDDASIIYRNFEGAPSKFNRAGDRNFAVVITEDWIADMLAQEGWNVKIKPPREEGEGSFMYLPVKVKFNERGPKIYLRSGENMVVLDEESCSMLDQIDIVSVDMDLRPYDWDVNGNTGRTAYLDSICVTQRVDRFAERYSQ